MQRSILISIAIILLSGSFRVSAQDIPVHISRSDIYDFLDELANIRAIEINSAARPFSRSTIARLLLETDEDALSLRQQKELRYYLGIFNSPVEQTDTTVYYFHELIDPSLVFHFPDGRYDMFSKTDGIFNLTVNPLLGYETRSSGDSSMFHRWNGLEAHASVGDNFSFYANLRDNTESIRLTDPGYLVDEQGANYKLRGEGGDYSEMRGGITWSWKWGALSLRKDHFTWGNAYHGANIFGGNQPSSTFIDLRMNPAEWISFRYVHAWLVSEVIDSVRSYAYTNSYGIGQRKVFVGKYLAANMLSVRPFPHTWLSIGNSIIYSDIGFHPAYLMPLGFYKSIDHTYNGTGSNALGHNSQMFADLSIREIPHTHLFISLFVDEIAFSYMWDKDNHSNLYSAKIGARISDLPLRNTGMTVEYTRSNPLVFRHNMPVTTFESNYYTLGHHLKDNAEELYLQLYWRPLRGLRLEAFYSDIVKGPDYNAAGGDLKGLPFISEEVWSLRSAGLKVHYQIFNNLNIAAGYVNHHTGGSNPDASDLYLPSALFTTGNLFEFSVGFGR